MLAALEKCFRDVLPRLASSLRQVSVKQNLEGVGVARQKGQGRCISRKVLTHTYDDDLLNGVSEACRLFACEMLCHGVQ